MGRQAIVFSKSLGEIAGALNSSLTVAEKLDCLVQVASRALGVRGCSLMLLDAKRKKLIHVATHGLSDRYVRAGVVEADKSLPEIMEGKTAAVTDTESDPRIQFGEMARREHIASILGVPVMCRGRIVGSLRAYNRIRREFTSAEEEYLITVANLAATVLESSGTLVSAEGSGSTEPKSAPHRRAVRSPVRAVSFAHPSEEDFARLLDFYQIEWVYEPRSFMLEWEGDKVTEMFTPDFYLPGLDLYIEMTTLKPGLTSQKNRKVRRLRELYPDTKIKLLARRDYDRLLAKYGHGPLAGAKTEGVGRILFSADQIQMRVRQLAKEISRDYEGRRILLVGVLRGMLCFMADLMRYLEVPADVDFMAISYYGSGDGGEAVHITKDLDVKPNGRDVVLVEDIVDTGMTLSFVLAHLEARHPATLAVCTLLDKKVRRLTDVPLAYVGFEVPDEFLVGYGLDYREEYRNLPFIALIRQQGRQGDIGG
ncbi:MAG: hypoxanthine phosphoribosyltransferase [Dehalococcoidia bacterium]|nr:hypoxanthine phosphoribosyltransferase [Dehalococcoidia bacterium]